MSTWSVRREPGDVQHDGGWVDPDHGGGTSGARAPDGDAGSAPDVDDVVPVADAGQPHGELGVGVAADVEAQRGDEATDTAESRVVGVMVGWKCRCAVWVSVMSSTLTLESEFKSSGGLWKRS